MSRSILSHATEFVLIEREVDSGLDSQDSIAGKSAATCNSDGTASSTSRGSPAAEPGSTHSGTEREINPTDADVTDTTERVPKCGENQIDEGAASSAIRLRPGYFKSPLEIELERKLEEVKASFSLQRNVQKVEMKRLAAMQVLECS